MAGRNASQNAATRKWAFGSLTKMGFWFGLTLAFHNSTQRLLGLTNNGLKWKYNLHPIKKYDFTSEYEKGTLWQYIRNK